MKHVIIIEGNHNQRVQGAEVKIIMKGGDPITTTAGGEGQFSFEDESNGSQQVESLEISKEGFETEKIKRPDTGRGWPKTIKLKPKALRPPNGPKFPWGKAIVVGAFVIVAVLILHRCSRRHTPPKGEVSGNARRLVAAADARANPLLAAIWILGTSHLRSEPSPGTSLTDAHITVTGQTAESGTQVKKDHRRSLPFPLLVK